MKGESSKVDRLIQNPPKRIRKKHLHFIAESIWNEHCIVMRFVREVHDDENLRPGWRVHTYPEYMMYFLGTTINDAWNSLVYEYCKSVVEAVE